MTRDRSIVMLLGIPGFQSISTDVVSGNLVSALRGSGMRVSEVRLSAPSALKWIRPRFVAEFMLRYLMYPACARRTYRRYGDAPVYFITDHASASISRSIPPPAKVIVLVHDLASILPPSELRYRPTWKNRLIHVLGVLFKKPGIMRADHVFTVSAAIKEDIVRRLGYPAEQITVIYNGVDAATFATRDKSDARTELGLEQAGQYLMTVTSPAARKNMPCLMRAMHQLAADFPGLKLLVVGGLDAEALHLIGELGLGDRIIRYRNISDDQIAALYAAADLYVFPSWYEGFGLPVVEAMACGCPVIVSDDPALVEVAGPAGLSFPANAPEKLADAVRTVLSDPALRDSLVQAGKRRAEEFTWTRTAQRVEAALRERFVPQAAADPGDESRAGTIRKPTAESEQ